MFSIIIPTYNSAKFIQQSLSSVASQTFKNFEVIITDDGSTDETLEIVKAVTSGRAEIKILENQHNGPGENRNIGIREASYPWIAFLDSDDYWENHKLDVVRKAILSDKKIDLICHNEWMKDGQSRTPLRHLDNFDQAVHPFVSLYRGNSLSTSAVVCRKEVLMDVGLFSPELPAAQDYDLWLRVALKYKISYIQDYLGYYVWREGNISSKPYRRYKCLSHIGRKYYPLLKQFGVNPVIEFLKFKARTLVGTGRDFFLLGYNLRGLVFISIGIILWPGILIKKIMKILNVYRKKTN